ncbi:hypothetical protein [Streptomyces sp. MI02-7b]|uniref:hypothetical protein n=1 Tax=Streptomyces sp. MI02-7b TaxID=462941 RepID=UPI0029A3CCF2|nr:hypothetical protein [Streptomyces sp. MI02-7b]MDX3076286.1 hypothetical protein [Streptomyces sp. MI02-7b]
MASTLARSPELFKVLQYGRTELVLPRRLSYQRMVGHHPPQVTDLRVQRVLGHVDARQR